MLIVGAAWQLLGAAVRALGTAYEIAAGSAKLIAGYWADGSVAPTLRQTAKRRDMHRLQELARLHRLATRACEVAHLLGLSPNTERVAEKALEKAGLLPHETPQRGTSAA